MMLKTSSNKNPALGLFLFTVKQNIGIIILTVICMLLVCPGFLLIHIKDTLDGIGNNAYEFNEVLAGFTACCTIAGALGVIVYNIINFMYLYSKKSSDVFHAIPLTRTQLLLSRGFAGIVSTLIPTAVGYISIICLTLIYPRIIADLEILAVGFFYNILIMFIAWSISLLFIICAGTAFDFILSFGIVNGALLLLPVIISVIADEYLYGYANRDLSSLLKWFSPIYFSIFSMEDFISRSLSHKIGIIHRYPIFNSNEWIMLAVGVIVSVLLTLLCIYLYNHRKAEKAGNAYAFNFIYLSATILLSFEVAYGMGIIFSEFEFNIIFWIFSIAGALLSAVIFGAVTERGFKTVKKSLILGSGSIVGLIAVFIIICTGGFGYENRVPSVDRVATVKINVNARDIDLSYDLDMITDLHKRIITESKENQAVLDKEEDIFVTGIRIEYTLKNGATMERDYWNIPRDLYSEDLVEIFKKEDIQSQITQLNLDKPENIYLEGHFDDGNDETNDYISFPVTREDAEKLFEIYKRENLLMTKEMFSDNKTDNFYIQWDTGYYSNHYYYEFYVGENYTEFLTTVNQLKDKFGTIFKEEY